MKTNQLEWTEPNRPKGTSVTRDPKKWQVAEQFEAMFVHQMLTAMRKTVPENGLTKESNGRAIFTDMLDDEMSKVESKQGDLGLAKMIYKQLSSQDPTTAKKQGAQLNHALHSQVNLPGTYSSAGRLGRASQSQVNSWIASAAKAEGLDPSLLRSLVHHESGGDSLAVSSKGAIGLTQLMPSTAKELGVKNPWDGRENVKAGARYLKKMLTKFNGREDLALAAYNAGPNAVIRHGGVPPYRETLAYVKKVLEGRNKMKNMEVEYAS